MIYKTQPMAHQAAAVEDYRKKIFGALFCEMGTGKSKIALDVIANTPVERPLPPAVIIAGPNGLHLNWEAIEVPVHYPRDWIGHRWNNTMVDSSNKRKAWKEFYENKDEVTKFVFINAEAIRTPKGKTYLETFISSAKLQNRELFFILDESTCIKNPKAQITKSAIKLASQCDRRFILNGTPITQSPLDLFSQCKFLHPKAIPETTYTAFKGRYAIETTVTMGNRSFRKILGFTRLEELTRNIQPFSLRLEKKDCLDLPEKVFKQELVEMTKEQNRIYAELKNQCLATLRSGEVVSATLALTQLVKLHQVVTGYVQPDDGPPQFIPNNRLKSLMQIAEISQPLVIFCAYRENARIVADALAEAYGGAAVVSLVGGTADGERTTAVQRFQSGEARFFVGTSAAAKGLTLHKASTIVYYSNNYSLETRLQSQDRIHRIGQTNRCTYIDLVSPNTVDVAILKALTQKHDLSRSVLDQLIEIIENP